MPEEFHEYQQDIKTKAACERYFEKIIKAAVDLAFLMIKTNRLKQPEDDKETFDILAKEKIITEELAERLKDAKGMRNIIAHQYGVVENEIVFNSITKEIVRDTTDIITKIKRQYHEKE